MLLTRTETEEGGAAVVEDDQNDKLLRAYVRLQALKANLPKRNWVEAVYADQYHEILSDLERIGFEVAEFRIPPDQLTTMTIGVSYNESRKSRSLYVRGPLLLAKMDAVLAYFELVMQKPLVTIGFKPPRARST